MIRRSQNDMKAGVGLRVGIRCAIRAHCFMRYDEIRLRVVGVLGALMSYELYGGFLRVVVYAEQLRYATAYNRSILIFVCG